MEVAVGRHKVSQRRACRLVGISRSVQRYRSRRKPDTELRAKVRAIAEQRPRFGHLRITALLRRQGLRVNHKRIYRICRQENLLVPRKRRKKLKRLGVPGSQAALRRNQCWAMDFVQDALANGRVLRALTVEDIYTREGLAITVDTSIPGTRVRRELDRLVALNGKPEMIRVDNGPEMVGRAVSSWCEEHHVQLRPIERGKPMQNGHIESFNGRFRDECLNANWFTSLADARQRIEAWRRDYNEVRPHSALGYRPPVEFREGRSFAMMRIFERGLVEISATPWAKVKIDGRWVAESTPVLGLALPVGAHTVELVNPRLGKSARRSIMIKKGARVSVIVRFD